jgi:hypothetical protein
VPLFRNPRSGELESPPGNIEYRRTILRSTYIPS